jgi:hypothetical protein
VKKIVNFIALAIIASLFLFVLYWNNKIMPAIFPNMQVVYETSMEPVDIYLGDVHYRVPKAYLYWPAHMNGGKLSDFSMAANIDEDMVPWTVSQNYKNKVKQGRITVHVYDNALKEYKKLTTQEKIKEYNEKLSNEEIERMLDRGKRMFPERYNEIDKGIYLNIFHRYDDIGKIDNSNRDGLGSGVYLVPQVKNEKSFFIRCSSSVLKHASHLCDVKTHLRTGIKYNFNIPFHSVDQYMEWDKKIEKLINNLIVRE